MNISSCWIHFEFGLTHLFKMLLPRNKVPRECKYFRILFLYNIEWKCKGCKENFRLRRLFSKIATIMSRRNPQLMNQLSIFWCIFFKYVFILCEFHTCFQWLFSLPTLPLQYYFSVNIKIWISYTKTEYCTYHFLP